MAHNPPNPPGGLAAVRQFGAPNLLVFTRANRAPVPTLDMDDREEKAARSVDADAGGGTKQELRGKSRQSSLNLARVLSSLDWTQNGACVHVTLSYWKRWPGDKDALAGVKSALVRDLGRRLECGIWSLEYQVERFEKFGEWVPHWHVLGWLGGRSADGFEVWLRKWWVDFAGNPSEHGVHVTSGDQARGTWYLAMHAAKLAQSPPFRVGRWWGYVNRDKLLRAQDLQQTGEPDLRTLIWWARLYRRSTGCKVRQRGELLQGFCWFLSRAAQCVAAAWIRDWVEHEKRVRFAGRPPF
jgi:hypothetical protein